MKMLFITLAVLFITACEIKVKEKSTDAERRKQEELNSQAVKQVGLPSIINFQEKRTYKMILELRDKEIKTVTYIVDMNGQLHKICDSIGYGIPYATQFTNPQRYAYQGATLPQADPNGLYSPSSADGTWVLCFDSASKKISPVLIEPRIIVSSFNLK